MAAYYSLKSLVQQAIRTNGNNEITGQVLQNVLMAMIDELGGENGYAGVATPSTNPGAPDGKVFYFATEAGTYTHFDDATLTKGIHLLVFNGVTWSHQTLYTIDSEVTSESNNLITSGAVYTKIINAINALDATVSKSAGADGLSLSLTEVDGKVTNISGSITPQTYDAYGAASAAQSAASTDATNKVNAAKTQILGDAASDYNTLGKLEDKIQAEASRAAAVESALNTDKADKATTLAGYGINDAYTKTEVNGLVSTPHQNYVTVPTYASLPATGSADTIYRVSNYNGSTSQVDASVYSEYAWNGSGYTFLRVDSQIGEVFDITVYNSNTKYADLAAALGTNGANVPSSIRRGGMSVKFVQSSDNNYVQLRYLLEYEDTTEGNAAFINPLNWINVEDEIQGVENAIGGEMKYSDSIYKDLYGYENKVNFLLPSLDSLFSVATITNRTRTSIKIEDAPFASGFYIPIYFEVGEYNVNFVFSNTGESANIRIYNETKTTVLLLINKSNHNYTLSVETAGILYLRLFTLQTTNIINISNATIINKNALLLKEKIGVNQLVPKIGGYFKDINDNFVTIIFTDPESGIASKSKTNNTISVTTNANSAYLVTSQNLVSGHKYSIYYNITGTGQNLENYEFQFKSYQRGWKKTISIISQTIDTPASGTIIFDITSNEAGVLSLNLPNHSGETISGDIYVYDVTGLTDNELSQINFSELGSGDICFINKYDKGYDLSTLWKNKKVVFYGDSITQRSYPELVQAVMKFNLYKVAHGGLTFTLINNDGLSADARINTIPPDADVVCIMGGTNDWHRSTIESELVYNNGFDRTYFKGAVAYTVTKIQARCANASIFLLTNIGGRGNSDPSVIQPLPEVSEVTGNTPLTIRNATIDVANQLNIPVIDTWSCGINGFNRSVYIADTVHPTTAGCQLIADYVIKNLIEKFSWN